MGPENLAMGRAALGVTATPPLIQNGHAWVPDGRGLWRCRGCGWQLAEGTPLPDYRCPEDAE